MRCPDPTLKYYPMSDFMDIPKNPVPSLPAHEPARTIFAAKPAADFHPGSASCKSDPPANFRPKLVARSPLHLRELGEYRDSPHTLYSSTRLYTRTKPHAPDWPQFNSPENMDPHSSLVHFESALALGPRPRRPSRIDVTRVVSENARCGIRQAHGTARSLSMIVSRTEISEELGRLAALVGQDSQPGCRASRGSDVTAISSQDTFLDRGQVGEMSPSRMSACTLEDESMSVHGFPVNYSLDEIEGMEEQTCGELVGMPLLETHEGLGTMLRVTKSVRRPYSEDFLQHARITMGTSLGLSVEESLYEVVCGSSHQREMYIRNSCADSGLVKSTFDLAKLLPATPQ
ncbi:hypothetical protein DL89DRAFT_263652 [Linderina pennispora]|uniref:Uncharacterized protein n=1 Tax=Linderina pennispora TaxID=61395 RepID=A0A1Y1WJV0_9FUNG|nr:uncharacterized protein DL89DRAFT_263652 [Linderina pennispora]ORX73608.1 hypothetical protein DL89DRAFT_263652 [Linderina pennispora]